MDICAFLLPRYILTNTVYENFDTVNFSKIKSSESLPTPPTLSTLCPLLVDPLLPLSSAWSLYMGYAHITHKICTKLGKA